VAAKLLLHIDVPLVIAGIKTDARCLAALPQSEKLPSGLTTVPMQYPRHHSTLALTTAWFPDASHFGSYCRRVEAPAYRSGLDHRHVKLYRLKKGAETSAEIPRRNGTSCFHHILRGQGI
jgi:hypothetical protein